MPFAFAPPLRRRRLPSGASGASGTSPASRARGSLALAALGFALASSSSGAALADARADARRAKQAARISSQMLAALVEASGVPGMGAAVWHDGKGIWDGSAGYRDLERKLRVDRNTIFRMASVSKLVTVTAAAKLKQEGKLDVDAPIASIVPGLSPSWAPFSARQLAAHISGLPHYQDVDQARGGTHYKTVEEAVKIFKDRALLAAPGTKYQYSSWGYTLLSAAVERAAGQPFLEYLARHITRDVPVARDATGKSPAAARAYEILDGKVVAAAAHDFSYTWGGGGLGATPRAVAELGGRIMTGKIVSPATFAWMLAPMTFADGKPVAEEDYTVGFGWRTGKDDDGRRIAHHAGNALGARSTLVLWPELGYAVSLLGNASWVSSIDQSGRMLAAPFLPEPASLSPAACPTQAARYEGTFDKTPVRGAVRFSVRDGLCVGELELGNALGEYLNSSASKKGATKLSVIGLDAKGGLSRAALVTPIGIYDLRATSAERFRAPIGRTRELVVSFAAPPAPPAPPAP
jgi:serine beta-lactamase-like protein LACTB, mitochondrial